MQTVCTMLYDRSIAPTKGTRSTLASRQYGVECGVEFEDLLARSGSVWLCTY
jgi:hypothetical protein